jgi:RimJ/RimL family protein N-acetyltransferase
MVDQLNFSVIETLRNGTKVEIRAQRPQDRGGLEAALARMSDESLYRRFFVSKHQVSENEAAYFLNINFVKHVALVVIADENGMRAIVGAGRYVIVQPGRAEVAFAVVDAYQGQGVGTALMRNLSSIARRAGLDELIAEVLANNSAMLKVFEKSGLQMSARREGSVMHVRLTYA